ncbi:MAG: hypothetical protein JST29_12295 [Bacteroidetes bacterium]|nr:hypothetical protein [Bacteroidota bacterium]
MFSRIKLNLVILFVSFTVVAATALAPNSTMFGKKFKSGMDYTCCKGNQLYVHHFYTKQFFWAEVGSGYETEPIGGKADGCNIECGE